MSSSTYGKYCIVLCLILPSQKGKKKKKKRSKKEKTMEQGKEPGNVKKSSGTYNCVSDNTAIMHVNPCGQNSNKATIQKRFCGRNAV